MLMLSASKLSAIKIDKSSKRSQSTDLRKLHKNGIVVVIRQYYLHTIFFGSLCEIRVDQFRLRYFSEGARLPKKNTEAPSQSQFLTFLLEYS